MNVKFLKGTKNDCGNESIYQDSLEEDKVVLAVEDQGKGIDSMIKEKMGTPFLTTK